jgi:branched-chain amino acid transport system ATP-binding protein
VGVAPPPAACVVAAGSPPDAVRGPLLDVRGLRAGPLRGLELTVAAGEVVALVGHEGAGKTAAAEVLAGVRRAEAGSIRLAGEEVSGADPGRLARLGVAFVPEGRRVFPGLTLEENLTLGAYRDRRDRALVAGRRSAVLARFPLLADRRTQSAATLSGGERQLLVIARALMSDPRLLVLDEPSAGLGPRAVDLVARALEAVRSGGTAVLLAERGLVLPRRIADRVLLLEDGVVSLAAPREAALADPRLGVGYLA